MVGLSHVTLQHVDHPFPRRFPRRVWPPGASSPTGQHFRKDQFRIFGTRKAHAPILILGAIGGTGIGWIVEKSGR
jgi:hypothetical protein